MKDRIYELLKSPSSRVLGVVLLIAVLFWIVRGQREAAPPPSNQPTSKLPLVGDGEKKLKEGPVMEVMKHFTPWRSVAPPQTVPEKKPMPSVEMKSRPAEPLPKLIHDYEVVEKAMPEVKAVKPAEPSIPFGSVIACQLLQSVKCGNAAVPVIAEVLQPVRDAKGLVWILPGTRIHGSLHSGSLPARLESAGGWTFVLPGQKLYEVKGSLQDRNFDPVRRTYGVNDGTAGIAGTTIKSSDWKSRAVKEGFAIAADATQDRVRTALGEVELGSARNAVLRGASSLVSGLPSGNTGAVEVFVTAPAGKEFYLYIEDRGDRNATPGTGEVETMLRERARLMEQLRQQTGKERP